MAGKQKKVVRKKNASGADKAKNIRVLLICALAVLIVVAGVLAWIFIAKGNEEANMSRDEILAKGTYFEGVSIANIDVSGMTLAEAKPQIEEKASQTLMDLKITYSAMGNTYPLTAEELGATIDVQAVMEKALFYGREGDATQRTAEINKAKEEGVNFPLEAKADEEILAASLETQGEAYNIEMQNATVSVKKNEDEKNLQVSGELEFIEEVAGKEIDTEKLIADIQTNLQSGDFTSVIPTTVVDTQPEITLEELKENCQLMASFSTSFKSSAYGRRYNIWKMSTVVNGVVLQPGESWSINEAAGPRTKENGWEDAAGIKNGAYVDEPGGGICQVSSTLYNALLKAEVEITDRSHHSWPLSYVDPGLDATISTGAPDFQFKNNYDYPITIIATTDAKNARTVKVSVYGPPMDYTVKMESKIVLNEEPGPAETVYSSEMKPGTSEWTKPRHNKIKAEVYKIKIDKETGKEISRELYYTDTYRAFTGQITIGPSATPKPETTPPATTTTTPATPTPSKSEAATPTPGNTTSPETGGTE